MANQVVFALMTVVAVPIAAVPPGYADDGVEVDLAALLVLGDFRVGERGVVAQGALGEPGRMGDLAAQVAGEAGPRGGAWAFHSTAPV